MLATTIQITNNPPHTTHTSKTGWLRRQPPPTRAADAHTVLNVNPTVCPLAKKLLCPTQTRTHTHHPLLGSEHMQAQENNHHNHNRPYQLFPTKWAP